MNLELSNWSYH